MKTAKKPKQPRKLRVAVTKDAPKPTEGEAAAAIAAIYPLIRELFAGRTANSKWLDE